MMPAGNRISVHRSRWFAALTVALLAVAASISGLANGFALDDIQIIAQNDRIHSLTGSWRVFLQAYWPPESGGSLYRPLTSLGFAIQWAIGNGSPLPFHVVSIALYATVSVAFLRFAEAVGDVRVAWLAAALFAVHPVHVEAVANVVGQAELLSALCAILAMSSYLRGRLTESMPGPRIAGIAGLFAAGLMFKEHVIVLPAILLALELIVVRARSAAAKSFPSGPRLASWIVIVALSFVVLRTGVIGNVHGGGTSPIFADDSFGTRLFTMFRVMLEWIRLFFWPAVLSADYSPSRILIAERFAADMIPAVVVLVGLTILGIAVRRTAPIAAFAIAWASVALLIPSNLVVVTGFVLAERTLFLASAGVVLACAYAIVAVARLSIAEGNHGVSSLVTVGVALILALGVTRSSTRNPVWRNNETLITQTVQDAPTSARAHMMLAQLNLERGKPAEALTESGLALTLGPKWDPQLFAFAGDVYQMNDKCRIASRLYARSLTLWPEQPQVRVNAAVCLLRTGGRAQARALLSDAGSFHSDLTGNDGGE